MPDRDLISARAAPPLRRIVLALAAMLALPLSSYVSGSSLGAYRMFTEVRQYRLELEAVQAGGARAAVPLELLGPHLGLDARRLILPASQLTFGETAASLLGGGLTDLAELACRLSPGAGRVRASLVQRSLTRALPEARAEVVCGAHAR
jgi:hypothetical protein